MEKLIKLSDEIWGYAETGFEEEKSCEAMVKVLEEEGFEVESNVCGMQTAYVATYGSGKPVIAFLAEYDALFGMNQRADADQYEPITTSEDTGHGCGHHLLGVGAMAAAIKFKNYLTESGKSGTCKIYGCPAEESGSGKAYFARDGFFEGVDIALTWHPGNYNQVTIGSHQSCISVFYKFHGISSHAAGSPHLGRSALDGAELMNVGVNYLREHMESTDRVHYAYTNVGGKAPNVVQAEAVLKYFIRSTTNSKCKRLLERVNKIAEGAALMTETKVEIIFDEGLSNVIPNFTLEEVLENSFKKLYKFDYTQEELAYAQKYKEPFNSHDIVIDMPDKVKDLKRLQDNIANLPINDHFVAMEHSEECGMGSTDVGDVSWVVPTAQINTACYAIAPSSHSWQWVAQGKSSIAHKGFLLAGDILADTAIELLNNPELVTKAQEEFKQRLNGETYECLIPQDVKPHVSSVD